ncbi:hypothetical protein LOD99_2952 [Oopsacas minuta]|uniref:Cation-transporting P-type ATPase C-terminal domain-containing protein n=1 Tax=Oopsacas minuta TaxID=111878 RepID=A0AAV7JZI2_9METZ|nr:hypothetical protein LOD99_2952 [Oopsacas minuta]
MGIAGTAVAKNACDIILTDDNFASIVKAVMWGRNVYDSISKFLQFQLTVNVVAVTVAFISALANATPLTIVQLLWVNIIMDSLASLALATEEPTPELLTRSPYGRKKPLITRHIFRFIFFHSILQLFIILSLFFAGHILFDLPQGDNEDPSEHFTMIFNTFVFLQLFNEVNARKIHGEGNVFRGIFRNWIFWAVIISSVIFQVIFIEIGVILPALEVVVYTKPLSLRLWFWCIFFGMFELIWNQIIRLYPVWLVPKLGWFTDPLKRGFRRLRRHNSSKRGHSPSALRDEEDDDDINARQRWILGIRRIQTQIRVVNAFRAIQDREEIETSVPPTPVTSTHATSEVGFSRFSN